jgi:hypothetical protein
MATTTVTVVTTVINGRYNVRHGISFVGGRTGVPRSPAAATVAAVHDECKDCNGNRCNARNGHQRGADGG